MVDEEHPRLVSHQCDFTHTTIAAITLDSSTQSGQRYRKQASLLGRSALPFPRLTRTRAWGVLSTLPWPTRARLASKYSYSRT